MQSLLREAADRLMETAERLGRAATSAPVVSGTAAPTSSTPSAVPASSSLSLSVSPSACGPRTPNSSAPSAAAEHARLFGYRPPTSNTRPRVSRGARVSAGRSRPYHHTGNRQTWTRAFVCLAFCGQGRAPSASERIELAQNDLGEKRLEFPRLGNGAEVHQTIIEAFPSLTGGYQLLRSEGRRSQDLVAIPQPSSGFSVEYLQSVLGQAKGYLRPIQEDIRLKGEQQQMVLTAGPVVVCINCGGEFPMLTIGEHTPKCNGGTSIQERRNETKRQDSEETSVGTCSLQQMFPKIPEQTIQNILDSVKGDCNRAATLLLRENSPAVDEPGDEQMENCPWREDVVEISVPNWASSRSEAVHALDEVDDKDDLIHCPQPGTEEEQVEVIENGLHELLESFKKKLSGPDLPVLVDQRQVVLKALSLYKDPKFDCHRPLRVTFQDQPAVDVGGPKTEFFAILFHQLSTMDGNPLPALFEGPTGRLLPVFNSSVVYSKIYVTIGKMIAHSITQCGEGFPYLSPCGYWYLVSEDLSRAVGYVTPEDVRDATILDVITKLVDAQDKDAMETLQKDQVVKEALCDAGYFELPTLDKRQLCIESMYLAALNKKKTVLDQLCKGLRTLNVLPAIQARPLLFEDLFTRVILNPSLVMSVLVFDDQEDSTKELLLKFLGERDTDALKTFVRYCTAGTSLPREIKVVFVRGDAMFASTCEKELQLPSGMTSYEVFSGALTSVMKTTGAAFNTM